jgi:hypothetical protein
MCTVLIEKEEERFDSRVITYMFITEEIGFFRTIEIFDIRC